MTNMIQAKKDKNICSVDLTKGMLGYLGNQPILRQGKNGPFTQFSLYNKYLPDGLNPIKVSVFGELALKVCNDLKEKNAIRVTFDKMAFGEVVHTQTGHARPCIYLTMKDYQLSEAPTQSQAINEEVVAADQTISAPAEISMTDEQQVINAIALLAKKGIQVAS